MTLSERLIEYATRGFAVFEQMYDATTVQALRDEHDRLLGAHQGQYAQRNPWWFGNVLERSPQLVWPTVYNLQILEFAEAVINPFLQLDNLTLAGFRPVKDRSDGKEVSGWHRDRWSHMPN